METDFKKDSTLADEYKKRFDSKIKEVLEKNGFIQAAGLYKAITNSSTEDAKKYVSELTQAQV